MSSAEHGIDVCFMNPAMLPEWFWLPTAHEVQARGLSYAVPELQRRAADATVERSLDAIEDTMADSDAQYVVALSRGVEFAVRYIDRMAKKGELSRVLGWMIISSVGPRGYETVSPITGEKLPRHTEAYAHGITKSDGGMETMVEEIARTVMLHDIQDNRLLEQTLQDTKADCPLSAEEIETVPRLPKNFLPLAWYVGAQDRVDNTELSSAVAAQCFGIETIQTGWGHVGPLTHPVEVAQAIAIESQQALITRGPRS